MTIVSVSADGRDTRHARRSCVAPLSLLTGAILMAAIGSHLPQRELPSGVPINRAEGRIAEAGPATGALRAESDSTISTLDALPFEPPSADGRREATGGPLSRWAWTQMVPPALPSDVEPETGRSVETQIPEPPRAAMIVPLPLPRPPEFRAPAAAGPVRRMDRRMARRDSPPLQPAAPAADDRSFLEKFFGIDRAPALAYAALESKPADVAPQRRISPPLPLAREPGATAGIAVYNIAARIVTLPSGERLEAHSGLGEGLDDPRLVNIRMRGPTPPGTYDLTEREQPFHGVRAIRLNPVGGSEAVYGRVGLLAHTYMLGPRGDSNGCVSFRDYDRFLQAFLRGEVQRLVVVSGTQDALPALADSGAGRTRLARNGG